jgi:hypothetical protein
MALACAGTAFAYSEQHDEYSLELKGFSPEMIDITEVQINRMEGRYPDPPPSKGQQFFYNLVNNQWTESLEPFGYDRVDMPKKPKRL